MSQSDLDNIKKYIDTLETNEAVDYTITPKNIWDPEYNDYYWSKVKNIQELCITDGMIMNLKFDRPYLIVHIFKP